MIRKLNSCPHSTNTQCILLSLLCCTSLLSDGAVAVQVGVFVDPSTPIGREQKVAIEIAVRDFHSTSTPLVLNVTNSSSEAEKLIEDWGPDVIIGTGSWPEIALVSDIGNRARVPVLSLAPSQPLTLAPKPYLFGMSPYSSAGYVQCIAGLVKLYNWRRVILVYEDDDYGSVTGSLIQLLSDALRSVRSEIDSLVAFPPLGSVPDPRSEVQRKLDRAKERPCKVFVVVRWSTPALACLLFEEANLLEMMAKGYVWLAGDDITSLLDSPSIFDPSFVNSYLQGVIGIKYFFNETARSYQEFYREFQRAFGSERERVPGVLALLAYDAVHLIARAVGGARKKRSSLSDEMRSNQFVGLSGRIRFKRDGGLDLVDGSGSGFKIVNVVGRSYRTMGFWSRGLGFYGDLGLVYWPGGEEKIPGGWGKLRIGVPDGTTYEELVKVERGEGGEVKGATGFCVEVFEMARRRLKYELPYELVPFNGTHDELVAGVAKAYDAAIGDISVRAKRLENAAFTEPFLSSEMAMLVHTKEERTPFMLTEPFTAPVWSFMASIFIMVCATLWYLEHEDNPEFDGPWWIHVRETLWLVLTSIFYANGRIYNNYSKPVLVVWFFAVWIMTISYTAALSAILTNHKLVPDLDYSKVGYNDPFLLKYSPETGHEPQTKRTWTTEDLLNGEVAALYLESPYLRLFLSRHDGYAAYGDTLNLGGFAFAFHQKDSPLAADFSAAILELSEDGTLKRLEDKWFSCSLTSCTPDNDSDSLSLVIFWPVFLVMGLTSTIIVLLFMARGLFQPAVGRQTLAAAASESIKERCSSFWRTMKERCLSLWRTKLGRKAYWLQLASMSSTSTTSTVPESGEGSPSMDVEHR